MKFQKYNIGQPVAITDNGIECLGVVVAISLDTMCINYDVMIANFPFALAVPKDVAELRKLLLYSKDRMNQWRIRTFTEDNLMTNNVENCVEVIVEKIYSTLIENGIILGKIYVGLYEDKTHILIKCCNQRDFHAAERIDFGVTVKISVIKMFFVEAFWVHDLEKIWIGYENREQI